MLYYKDQDNFNSLSPKLQEMLSYLDDCEYWSEKYVNEGYCQDAKQAMETAANNAQLIENQLTKDDIEELEIFTGCEWVID